MAKSRATLKVLQRDLAKYKFDTSTYIVLDSGVRRDSASGKLVLSKSSAKIDPKK
jgi:hypothetical protein